MANQPDVYQMVKESESPTPPVDIDLAKQRLQLDGTAFDADIEMLIDVAVEAVESHTGLVLQESTWLMSFSDWPCACSGASSSCTAIFIPKAPVRSILEISYLAEDLTETTIDPESYWWQRTDDGAEVFFVDGYERPTIAGRANAIRISFTAGMNGPDEVGSGAEESLKLSARAQMCILFLVASWWGQRSSLAEKEIYEVPETFKFLANQLRVVW